MPSFSSGLNNTSVFTSHLRTYFPLLHFIKFDSVVAQWDYNAKIPHETELLLLCCEADVKFSFFLDKFLIFRFLRELKHRYRCCKILLM